MPVSEMTYWWDCDDELMFSVFHMWAEKYIRKTFSIARSILVRPYGWSTRSDSSSKRIGPARTSSRSPQRIRRIGWRTRLFIGGRGLRQSASTKRRDGARSTTPSRWNYLSAATRRKRMTAGAGRWWWRWRDVPKDAGGSSAPAHGRRPQCPRKVRGFDGDDRATDVAGYNRGQEQGSSIWSWF
ncbi:uncharacterized protein LOC105157998 isoform X3 [Sesamum indicum]|uniref:Uncharacterized protein LOC105157998 isoform X3 n=1 Tax=Sesamum indicum TaxID=4182 RepID=A0A6I9SSC6_SESIN|nr:uncharacterized protein LOC105157998 isoform X3 [Sesamum indicum]